MAQAAALCRGGCQACRVFGTSASLLSRSGNAVFNGSSGCLLARNATNGSCKLYHALTPHAPHK